MKYPDFDMKILRSFVTGIEMQNFAKAADRLALSTSAISAQMKRLEGQVGTPIFRKSGRGLALTDAGEMLLSYARKLLTLNDETALAMLGPKTVGTFRIGLQHDFAEFLLPNLLGQFARVHPNTRIEVKVARNHELLDLITKSKLDFALAWEDPTSTHPFQQKISDIEMCWLGPDDETLLTMQEGAPLPLVVYDTSCRFRKAAIDALDRAGIPWQITLTSPDMSGITAGLSAGLGLSVRTALCQNNKIRIYTENGIKLPELPSIGLSIYRQNYQLNDGLEFLLKLIANEF